MALVCKSKYPQAELCLRTNEDRQPELYVVIQGNDYVIGSTISVDLRVIESGSLLIADIAAHISKLG